jgi:hypothetical protein
LSGEIRIAVQVSDTTMLNSISAVK